MLIGLLPPPDRAEPAIPAPSRASRRAGSVEEVVDGHRAQQVSVLVHDGAAHEVVGGEIAGHGLDRVPWAQVAQIGIQQVADEGGRWVAQQHLQVRATEVLAGRRLGGRPDDEQDARRGGVTFGSRARANASETVVAAVTTSGSGSSCRRQCRGGVNSRRTGSDSSGSISDSNRSASPVPFRRRGRRRRRLHGAEHVAGAAGAHHGDQ